MVWGNRIWGNLTSYLPRTSSCRPTLLCSTTLHTNETSIHLSPFAQKEARQGPATSTPLSSLKSQKRSITQTIILILRNWLRHTPPPTTHRHDAAPRCRRYRQPEPRFRRRPRRQQQAKGKDIALSLLPEALSPTRARPAPRAHSHEREALPMPLRQDFWATVGLSPRLPPTLPSHQGLTLEL